MEIVVPRQTVTLSPGTETRHRIRVANHGATQVAVRVGVSRGRAAAWAHVEPPVVAAPPGESTGVDLVFRPPASALPQATLQPFTVQAEDMGTGAVIARATGLAAVTRPAPVRATLLVEQVRRRTVTALVTVANHGTENLVLAVRPRMSSAGDPAPPPGGPPDRAARRAARRSDRRATATPAVLELAPGTAAVSRVVARPRRAFVGREVPWVLTVRCADVADEPDGVPGGPGAAWSTGSGVDAGVDGAVPADAPQPAVVTHTGTARPRLRRPTATALGLLLVAALTAGGIAVSRHDGVAQQLARFNPFDRTATGGAAGRATDPVAGDTVRVDPPYVLVDVFPRTNEPGGRAPAEATLDRLNAEGMGVRLVDSTGSRILADGPNGFYVLLRDGFDSVRSAQAYCLRFKIIAPNCQVVP